MKKEIRNRTIANVFLWNFEVAHKTVYLYGRKKRRKESYNYRKMQERIEIIVTEIIKRGTIIFFTYIFKIKYYITYPVYYFSSIFYLLFITEYYIVLCRIGKCIVLILYKASVRSILRSSFKYVSHVLDNFGNIFNIFRWQDIPTSTVLHLSTRYFSQRPD